MLSSKKLFTKSLAVLASVALAASAGVLRPERAGHQRRGEHGSGGGDFVFAASSDPAMLDPALASDGETFRPARQMFEGLVGTKPGTTDLEPLLATEWEASKDGKSYTFTLRRGVKFHDGTDFNAAAVCTNFDRWYNWTGSQPEREHQLLLQSCCSRASRPARPAASTTPAPPRAPTRPRSS